MDTDVTPTGATHARTTDHVVVMGVAGSGKTTIAALLADRLGLDLAEADEFHPEANIAKMSAGEPLDDDDRRPWLEAIRDWLDERTDAGRSAVVTCSALRRSYRDVLRTAHGHVRFLHLDGTGEVLARRMTGRTGHFMPPELLPSQLATLEPLDDDEDGLVVDITTDPATIVADAVAWLAPTRAR
ncbi:gluconokinase [Isoptericola jiangsuensis]|uniref:gluconokinase n=1 Tax=Isoptericola jiangsuensis TaxID=548579 RepID=UPI003AAF47C9